jgi:hypothetical protein
MKRVLSVHSVPVGGGKQGVCLALLVGDRRYRLYLTPDEAQHVSNRLQSFAKGNQGYEVLVFSDQ